MSVFVFCMKKVGDKSCKNSSFDFSKNLLWCPYMHLAFPDLGKVAG